MQISETMPVSSETKAPLFETDERTFCRCTACRAELMPEISRVTHDAMVAANWNAEKADFSTLKKLMNYHAEGECLRLDVLEKMAHPEPTAIIIPREHQSAPKEHWAEKVVRQAATEIVEGQFKVKDDPEEFWNYGETMTVAEHPAVKEAMEKMKREMEAPRNTQEYLEKFQMYHEMNERAQRKDQWDGQGRWIGKDNEEMRKGQILSPFQFMQKLNAVIGEGRVEMNYFGIRGRIALLAPDKGYVKSLIHTLPESPYQLERLKGKLQVGTLQYPLGTEWMIMRFNQYGVPTTARYLGWRTALLSMIKLGVISEAEAHKAFPLSSGPAADWYKEQLYMHRNGKQVAHA